MSSAELTGGKGRPGSGRSPFTGDLKQLNSLALQQLVWVTVDYSPELRQLGLAPAPELAELVTWAQAELFKRGERRPPGKSKAQRACAVEPSLLLTIPAAAHQLQVSESTVWRRIRDGALPAVRDGNRCTRIHRTEIEQFASHGTASGHVRSKTQNDGA